MKSITWLSAALACGFLVIGSTAQADPTGPTGTPGAPASAPMRPAPASTPTVFTFESRLRNPYRLRRVRVWVDGALRYDGQGPLGIAVARGDHLVSVSAEYQMSDPVFSYVSAYRIEIRADEVVTGRDDGRVVIARAIESGDVTTPIERRARIVWR